MDKLKLISIMIALVLVLPIISAEASFIFKQNEQVDLKIPVYDEDNNRADATITCVITIRSPTSTLIIDNQNMTFNSGGIYNYTMDSSDVSALGEYPCSISCEGGTVYGFSTFSFEITSTGGVQSSVLDNSLLIVFLILGFALVIFGAVMGVAWFGFIGSVMFLMGGVYTMIYGLNSVADMYTRAVAIVILGLGFIFMFLSAYEWLNGGEE